MGWAAVGVAGSRPGAVCGLMCALLPSRRPLTGSKDGTQPGVLPDVFDALEARYGRLCGEAGVRSGAGIGAAVDQ